MLLCNLLNIIPVNDSLSSDKFAWNSITGSLTADYNFALLPVFFGMIAILFYLNEPFSLIKKGILNLVLIIYSTTILFSGSRRGLITFSCIILILLVIQLFAYIRKDSSLKKILSGYLCFILSVILLTIFSWSFAFHGSSSFKNRALEFIGSKNILLTKRKLALVVYRYSSSINSHILYKDIYEKIWLPGFDKALNRDRDIGWDIRINKTIYPLKGTNVEIVPHGSAGYLMDSTYNAYSSDGNAYSYTLIGADNVEHGDSVLASVYCYVSKDFNGGGVKIITEGATYGNTVTEYNVIDSLYGTGHSVKNIFNNFNDKNDSLISLHKTNSKFNGISESSVGDIASETKMDDPKEKFLNQGKNLFSNGDFKDSTLYWFPGADSTKHEIIETPFGNGIRVSRTNGDGASWSLLYTGRPIIYYADHSYRFKFNFKVEKGTAKPFNIGWWVNEPNKGFKTYALPLTIKNIKDGWKEATCSYKFKETHLNLLTFLNSLQDNSIVDIANVELVDLNSIDSLPLFVDQFEEINKNNKGVWQKLILKVKCNKGSAPFYLCFSKIGVTDFSYLKGYVIFAYPEYKVIRNKDSGKSLINLPSKSRTSDSFNSECVPIYRQNLIANSSNTFQYRTGLFTSGIPLISTLFSSGTDKDPVRKLASGIISEDTTYFGYKNELIINKISNKFIGPRVMHWQFAWQIFSKEFNWRQKAFGGGFNFLNWFGFYFLKNKSSSDYPHNPFLSVLLYSGLFGLIIYLIFMYKVFYYYIKYFREYLILSILFLVTFFFSIFSGCGPFDPPIMGFFMLLPFFIHYVHQKPEKI
ncbi:MAG: hypothetical protein NT144_13305 [Bacteroidia bacterium]|nr:hypothetical protein [Bacteroidia bacterium]